MSSRADIDKLYEDYIVANNIELVDAPGKLHIRKLSRQRLITEKRARSYKVIPDIIVNYYYSMHTV